MNREIKFRAFDKKTKSIRNVMSISFEKREVMIQPIPTDGMYEFFRVGDTFSGGYVRSIDDVYLMQFTGQKDANIEEIFEGDLLRDCEDVYVVEWNNDDAMFTLACGNILLNFCDCNSDWYEVVGNIYDNKELA